MSEPIKGFNAAQRAYDAQEPPEYWAPEPRECPECGAGEMIPQKKRTLVSDTNPQRYQCEECGYSEQIK
jgi:DNA-directed RNA polymerase subunit M/transcription elongation factor TFIIS